MTKRQCWRCEWFDFYDLFYKEEGECRRCPPTPEGKLQEGVWPTISMFQWCGEFQEHHDLQSVIGRIKEEIDEVEKAQRSCKHTDPTTIGDKHLYCKSCQSTYDPIKKEWRITQFNPEHWT